MMQRGTNSTFYFVESDSMGTSDIIVELKLEEMGKTFTWKRQSVHTVD